MLGELHPEQRKQLDMALDLFEDAMAKSDRNEFEFARQALMITLSSLGIEYKEASDDDFVA